MIDELAQPRRYVVELKQNPERSWALSVYKFLGVFEAS